MCLEGPPVNAIRSQPTIKHGGGSSHVRAEASQHYLLLFRGCDEVRIWTGCDYICSAYDDGKDSAFYMCHDRISSLVAASVSGTDSVDAVLGCQVRRNKHSREGITPCLESGANTRCPFVYRGSPTPISSVERVEASEARFRKISASKRTQTWSPPAHR